MAAEVWIHRRTGERVEVLRFYYVGTVRRVSYRANGAAYNVAAARWEEAYRREEDPSGRA